jgi:hypothetical protein
MFRTVFSINATNDRAPMLARTMNHAPTVPADRHRNVSGGSLTPAAHVATMVPSKEKCSTNTTMPPALTEARDGFIERKTKLRKIT